MWGDCRQRCSQVHSICHAILSIIIRVVGILAVLVILHGRAEGMMQHEAADDTVLRSDIRNSEGGLGMQIPCVVGHSRGYRDYCRTVLPNPRHGDGVTITVVMLRLQWILSQVAAVDAVLGSGMHCQSKVCWSRCFERHHTVAPLKL